MATAGAPVPLSDGPVERDRSADYINRAPTVAGISQKRIAGFFDALVRPAQEHEFVDLMLDRISVGRRMTFQAVAGPQPAHDRIVHRSRNPIYLQEWWWEVAGGGRHQLVAVFENGREVGRLLYFPRTRHSMGLFGFTEGVHAPWTNYCAPTIEAEAGDSDAARQGDVAYELARQLPRRISYRLTCPHFTHDAVLAAFERAGFGIDTQRSYLVDLRGAGIKSIIEHLDMSTRQRYRKAEKKLDVVAIGPSMFFDLYRRNLAARDKISYHDLSVAESLASTCLSRGSGCVRITAAKAKGTPGDDPRSYHAAIACLQDDAFSYYWMSTRNINATDSDIRNGAVKLLLVDAIAHASQAGLVFDFDGATTRGTSELYRGFRGTEVNRYALIRKTLPARAIAIVRNIVTVVPRLLARRKRLLRQLAGACRLSWRKRD